MNTKKIILFVSLLYFTLIVPLLFLAYSNSFYEFNYEKQGTYNKVQENYVKNGTSNLLGYFREEFELNDLWTKKEKLHFSEVRDLYKYLTIILIICSILIVALYNKELVKKYTKINAVIILSLLLIIPIFATFWDNIFHIILFNNNYWITYPNELSFYLFEYEFFKNSLIAIIFISTTLNLIFNLITKIERNFNE